MKSKIKHILIGFGYCIFYACWFASAMFIFIASFWTTPGWLAILAFVAGAASLCFISHDFMKIGAALTAAKEKSQQTHDMLYKYDMRPKEEA